MTLKAVLFDLDGTLLDTAPDLGYALNQVLIEDGRDPLPHEQIRPWASHGSVGLLALAYQDDPASPAFAELRRRFLSHYAANLVRETAPFPGMHAALSEIVDGGLQWGIITNKPAAYTDPLVAALDWPVPPGCVLSGDSAARPKPDPASILMACEHIGVSPDECVYIGDAQRDIEAGNRAGMPTLAALWGYIQSHERPDTWQADALLESPADIMGWISNGTVK